jgi:hypothetical protein
MMAGSRETGLFERQVAVMLTVANSRFDGLDFAVLVVPRSSPERTG